ncbi:hypothetical protein AY600_16840 [Phormidium willei BDU 130791]|nr:hypothetical protein AY600_16840 [Phormidium willei BDU 130791]
MEIGNREQGTGNRRTASGAPLMIYPRTFILSGFTDISGATGTAATGTAKKREKASDSFSRGI